jgi:hypothetical protein
MRCATIRRSGWLPVRRWGYDERGGHVPPCLIHKEYGMGTQRDGSSDFRKKQVHRVGIAERQDKPCTLS